MILYFSASGNTEYIAKLLAKELDDECIDMNECIRTDDYTRVFSKKPFVICTPVYVCDMPTFVREYIKRLPFRGNRKVYYVFTSGGYAGMAGTTATVSMTVMTVIPVITGMTTGTMMTGAVQHRTVSRMVRTISTDSRAAPAHPSVSL